MKKIIKLISLFIGLILFFSCAEEQTENIKSFDKDESFYIQFGTECGWCAGQEFIKITESKVVYTRTIPCGDNKGTISKNRVLIETEWDELINSYDSEKFLELDYNNCNVCVDGCDEIIRIGNEDSSHEIRYTPSENIESMQNLKTNLIEIMEEMRQQN